MIALAVGLVALEGCASVPANGYGESDLPDDRVAILDWSGWGAPAVLEIDAKKPMNKNRVKLAPGRHSIGYGGVVGTSVLLNPKGFDQYERSATIDMKAGHVYATNRQRIYGYPRSYRDYLWIEDTTTGEVVAGELPPHEREKAERSENAAAAREVREHFEALSASAACADARAQYDLGLYYLAGTEPVGRRDLMHAYVWYSLAASNGHPDAAAVRDRVRDAIPPDRLAGVEALIADARLAPCETQPSIPADRAQPGEESMNAPHKAFPPTGPP